MFGLEEEVKILDKQSSVSKLCRLLQSYYVVASRLIGGDFVGGEMTVNLVIHPSAPRTWNA